MNKQKELLWDYFKLTAKPEFNNFVQKKQKSIENVSVHIETETALELHRIWVKAYNDNVQIKRPGRKLQARPIRVSEKFKMIYEISKAKRKARHSFRLASVNVTSEVLEASAENQEEEEESDKDSDDDDEVNEDKGVENDVHHTNLDFIMKEKIADLDTENTTEEELKKLINSSCVNLLNAEYQQMYSKIIPEHMYRSIIQECVKNKQEFNKNLTKDTASMIKTLFDELKKFQFDDDTKGIARYIDYEKAKIEDKLSDQYNLLCIVDVVVKSFNLYKKENNLSEATYLRKFEQLLDHLFVKTRLIFKDGETVSQCTKRMQIINEEEVDYGRRIDLLISTEQVEDDKQYDDIELCSVEFKKANESNTILNYQQSKNLRINACILNDIRLLVGNTDSYIPYLDFAGRRAYISQLFICQGCYVAHKVGDFTIPKSLMQLEQLRKSILNLYTWKQCLITNSNLVSLARLNEDNKFALADVSNTIIRSPTQSPPHEMQATKIFLSPSKSAKRTRSVFEQEN